MVSVKVGIVVPCNVVDCNVLVGNVAVVDVIVVDCFEIYSGSLCRCGGCTTYWWPMFSRFDNAVEDKIVIEVVVDDGVVSASIDSGVISFSSVSSFASSIGIVISRVVVEGVVVEVVARILVKRVALVEISLIEVEVLKVVDGANDFVVIFFVVVLVVGFVKGCAVKGRLVKEFSICESP